MRVPCIMGSPPLTVGRQTILRMSLGCLLDEGVVILIADQNGLRTVVLRNEIRLAGCLQCSQDVFELLPHLADGNSLDRHRISPVARSLYDKTTRPLETRSSESLPLSQKGRRFGGKYLTLGFLQRFAFV